MSLRTFFLDCSRRTQTVTVRESGVAHHNPQKMTWRYYLVQFLIVITLLLSAIWLLMAIWYQFGARSVLTWLATVFIVGLLATVLSSRYWMTDTNQTPHNITADRQVIAKKTTTKKTKIKWLMGLYAVIWFVGVGWFMSITPEQQRDWMPEVNQKITYERDPNNPDLITLTNVRNFDWHTEDDATARWETRTIDMSKLSWRRCSELLLDGATDCPYLSELSF